MEKKKKNNAFRWILHFAGQCRGRLTASVLLAILGSACGVVPYLAVTQIIIRILGKTTIWCRLDCWRSLRCWAISAEPG